MQHLRGRGGVHIRFWWETRETWEGNIKIGLQEVGWGRGLD